MQSFAARLRDKVRHCISLLYSIGKMDSCAMYTERKEEWWSRFRMSLIKLLPESSSQSQRNGISATLTMSIHPVPAFGNVTRKLDLGSVGMSEKCA